MKVNMYAIPATEGYTDIIAKVLYQNTAVDSHGLNPAFKIIPGERIVCIAVSSEGNKNWAKNGIPKKIAGRCAPAFKLPEFWPARCFEGLNDGDIIELSINGHDIELVAAQAEYLEVPLSFKDAVTAFLIEDCAPTNIEVTDAHDTETAADAELASQTTDNPTMEVATDDVKTDQTKSEAFTVSATTCLIGGAFVTLAVCAIVYAFKRN